MKVIEDLEADCALARYDEWIGIRMDECLALLLLDPVRERERVVVHVALKQDLGAVCLTHADDRVRNAAWHDHGRRRAER